MLHKWHIAASHWFHSTAADTYIPDLTFQWLYSKQKHSQQAFQSNIKLISQCSKWCRNHIMPSHITCVAWSRRWDLPEEIATSPIAHFTPNTCMHARMHVCAHTHTQDSLTSLHMQRTYQSVGDMSLVSSFTSNSGPVCVRHDTILPPPFSSISSSLTMCGNMPQEDT